MNKMDTSAMPGLGGFKVIEVSHSVEGAYCARLLGDAGAGVIKIEPPQGDSARHLGPFPNDLPDDDSSGLFHYLNTNKHAITLDLETEVGSLLLHRLVKIADVLVSDLPPQNLEKFGLLYDQLKVHNPKIVACSVTPFGRTGPCCNDKADDLIVLSMGGITAATPGFPDYVVSREKDRPLRAQTYTAGIISGATAAGAILVALFARMLDGLGRQVDISQQEAVASTMIRDIASYSYAGIVSGRRTEEEQSGTAYAPNVYLPCKDGMVVIVTASEAAWKTFVDLIGSPSWCTHPDFADTAGRARNINKLLTHLVEWTKTKTGAEITSLTQSNGLPCAHVLRIPEVINSDHARERAAFVDLEMGGHACRMPGPPFRIEGVFGEKRSKAPSRGQDNNFIYCGELGLTSGELVQLRGMGVI